MCVQALGDLPLPNPSPDWITGRMWGELCRASDLSPETGRWAGLAQHVTDNVSDWRALYDSLEPHTMALPHPWHESLDAFQRLLVLRAIRPDKVRTHA